MTMIGKWFGSVFGSRNERLIKQLSRDVVKINALEERYASLSDEELQACTKEFQDRISQGESLDDLLQEAFAVVREAGKRVLNMRHFDVQLIGGMVLHQGKIAEMRTGEGKTLVATLAAYLNALTGAGVHIVTVNDYLARRDSEWMGKLYTFLGLSTGVVVPGQTNEEKETAYKADITYGTNNEFGFDYLRDNMAFGLEDRRQRGLPFGIVDEVDSILIDEARTPLIISGAAEDSSELYMVMSKVAPELVRQEEKDGPGDYSVEEKDKQIHLTDEGHEHAEQILTKHGLLEEGHSLYDAANLMLIHHLHSALRAAILFHRDVDYIVSNNEVVIVDEFTGRTMPGRRWGEGLHQAIEAKEEVSVQNESQTLASITFQNYFRMYEKLSGMTGTADTEAFEFQQIYGLEVVVIPTDRPMVRDDSGDLVFISTDEKFEAILKDVQDCKERKQPVLVGTASIETSELISKLLKKSGIKHEVLNAKKHQKEAKIIAEAGCPEAVTIATNMAGRGTDIVLGGNLDTELKALGKPSDAAVERIKKEWSNRHKQVLESGGLHIIGTERHESRRIDNQLRGRSGRQGDPGSSQFYLSLEDNLMRIFASDRVSGLMQKLGMEEGDAIEHPWVSKAIENAQRKVEAHNFDIRKNLLEFDDVANDQRKVIYEQRNELMEAEDVSETVRIIRGDVVAALVDDFIAPGSMEEQWDVPGLQEAVTQQFGSELTITAWLENDESLHEESLRQRILETLEDEYAEKEKLAGPQVMRHFEKALLLQILDKSWKEHLAAMDYLRQGIGLRSYGQKNPKQEYKREAFEMFTGLLDRIKQEAAGFLASVRVKAEEDVEAVERHRRQRVPMKFQHEDTSAMAAADESTESSAAEEPGLTYVRSEPKQGRNEPCPCGSGKKYKRCHGKLE